MKSVTTLVLLLLLLLCTTALSTTSAATTAAFMFGSGISNREQLKKKILELSTTTKRGRTASSKQQEEMLQLFEMLEQLNPTKQPLKSPRINGDWNLEYTTSDTIVGKGGFPRIGPIVQTIDSTTLRAENSEVVQYFGTFSLPRKVTARLSPVNNRLTNVQFEQFMIGPVTINAPESAKGQLDITYLDNTMRLSRGDKGNIFVLTRMN